ncbi:hypothetical protein PI126_g13296 [Phytophthora idaei]|nr:hypothetical protein PI126_g13296 [Phytophthora idaei]
MGDEQEATASASGNEDATGGDCGEDQADPDMDVIMSEEKDPRTSSLMKTEIHTKRDCPSGSGGQTTGLFSARSVLTESAAGQALAGRRNSDRERRSEQKKAPAVAAEGMAGVDDSSNRSTASRRTSQKKKTKPSFRPEAWVYDCGANRHLVGDKRYFVEYRSLTAAEREKETVQGYNTTSAPIGIDTIDLWVEVNGGHVALRLEQVYYSRTSSRNR